MFQFTDDGNCTILMIKLMNKYKCPIDNVSVRMGTDTFSNKMENHFYNSCTKDGMTVMCLLNLCSILGEISPFGHSKCT